MQKLLKLFRSTKGFTLIELLIVIAILGVLAAVVLVAINPTEQLKRGRDASRITETAQLGHAASSFYTSQGALLSTITSTINCSGGGTQVAFSSSNWQDILKCTGDLSAVVAAPGTGSSCSTTGATSPSSESSFCYGESSPNYLVWTKAESSQSFVKAGCTSSQDTLMVYDSSQGKTGLACVTSGNAPTAGITLK